MKTEMKEIFL